MRSTFRYTIVRALAIIVFTLSGVCLLVALVNGKAWNDPSYKFDVQRVGPITIDLNLVISSKQGTVPEAAFTVLFAVGTILAIPFGSWLWQLANQRKYDVADDDNIKPQLPTLTLGDYIEPLTQLPSEVLLRDRNRIMTTSRLRLIALMENNSTLEASNNNDTLAEFELRKTPLSEILPEPKRPYAIKAKLPHKLPFLLDDNEKILTLVGKTKNWRIVIGIPEGFFTYAIPVETEFALSVWRKLRRTRMHLYQL